MDRTYHSGSTTINVIGAGRVEDLSGFPAETAVVNQRDVPGSSPAPAATITRSAAESVRSRPQLVATRENPISAAIIGIVATAIILGMIALFARGVSPGSGVALASIGSCHMVRIERPDTDRAAHISVRFRTEDGTGDVAGIAECITAERGSVTAIDLERTGGVKLRLKLDRNAAFVSLPRTFVSGTADQVVCSRTPVGEIAHRKYATSWTGNLPGTLRLSRLDIYDRRAADAACAAIT